MPILLLAEHNNKNLQSSTLNCINAAMNINNDLHVLLVGYKNDSVANELVSIPLIKKVLQLDSPEFEYQLAESVAPVILKIADQYSHIIAPATAFGKNILPRVAAILDVSQVSDITKIENEDTFVRPIYAGNALAKIQSTDAKKIITIRPTSFDPAPTTGGTATIEKITSIEKQTISKFIKREESRSDRPELGTARIVISGGRGLQSSENFSMINDLADRLNAAVGASRAAVDAGYVSNDYQVGQTGKVVVPELYIAVGISGAIQHLAGMKESKIIVAINKDEEAPIFNVADYGLKADLFEALPQLCAELDKLNTIQK